MSLHIKACDPDNPYGEAISTFFAKELPANLDSKPVLLDALTDAFVATGQIRQGAAPSPESVVALRNKLRYYIDAQLSIAVIVPWGSRKPDNSGVDVAELFALKQLLALDARVRTFYPAGTNIQINAEDLGGAYLWPDLPQYVTDDYMEQLFTLTALISNGRMEVKPESSFTTYKEFETAGDQVMDHLVQYLTSIDPSRRRDALGRLNQAGWVGSLTDEQVDFYLRQYVKSYPTDTDRQHREQLARYYAQAYARYKTGARGFASQRAVFINFPQAVPGAPESLFLGRMFYRTLPTKFARTHIPPWRAKGYLLIGSKGEVTPKVATVHDHIDGLTTLNVELMDEHRSVKVSANFVVEEG